MTRKKEGKASASSDFSLHPRTMVVVKGILVIQFFQVVTSSLFPEP
jgi:hypothetical protein